MDKNACKAEGLHEPADAGNLLKVLIVGESDCLQRSAEILEALLAMGYGVNLLGVIDGGKDVLFPEAWCAQAESPGVAFRHLLRSEPPDLLIITSDDNILRKILVKIIPSQTRVLDSFALKIFRALKDVRGQLTTTRDRLESVELIKEMLMAGSEVNVMVVDEDLRILDIGSALLKKTDLSREDCMNMTCHWAVKNLVHPCHERGDACVVREVLRTGRAKHTVQEEIRHGKESRFFTVSGYPLKDDERGKKNVLIIWKDITRGMASVLDRQARSIKENFTHFLQQDKMVALGKLAAAAVHEINNPVQGILTFAKLMRASLDKDSLAAEEVGKFRTYLDMIAEESSRCGKILGSLLSFSRKGDFKKTAVDLAALVEDVEILMGRRMALAGITFEIQISEALPMIHGDRDQIKQGLLNLVLNAVEAMPDGGTIKISADTVPDEGNVRIRIADTGTGVPKDIQGNIFEPFFTTKESGKGVGLGLSVVYGIVTQHGGTIELQSMEGKGSTFTMNLPAADELRLRHTL